MKRLSEKKQSDYLDYWVSIMEGATRMMVVASFAGDAMGIKRYDDILRYAEKRFFKLYNL